MTDNLMIWLSLLTLGVGVGLVFILLASAKVVAAIRTIKGDGEKRELINQPLSVKEHTEFATKKEMEGVKHDISVVDADLKSLRREITENGERRRISIEGKVSDLAREARAQNEALRREMKEDNENVHERINDVLTAVAELKGKVDA